VGGLSCVGDAAPWIRDLVFRIDVGLDEEEDLTSTSQSQGIEFGVVAALLSGFAALLRSKSS